MSIIELNHVTKEYRLGQLRSALDSLKSLGARIRGTPVASAPRFKSIDDLNIKVEAGEVVGIIGVNGAGKSTLLKLLARVSRPTTGSIKVNGSVAPLIEVGAGLVPDLTGRENIFVNGTILGMSRAEIRRKFDDIVGFAELEEFVDTPIKRYSSGMQVRLGFSVATSVDADILIVDEVLAVGDLAFQRKCFDRIESLLKQQGNTVLIVSHNIRQVQRLCKRVILLEHGRVKADGPPVEICDLFYEKSDKRIQETASKELRKARGLYGESGETELESIEILDEHRRPVFEVPYHAPATVSLRFKVWKELTDATFEVGVHTTDFLYLTTHNSEGQLHINHVKPGICVVECRIGAMPLFPGVYSLRVAVTAGAAAADVFYAENVLNFQVVNNPAHPIPVPDREGFFALNATWHIEGAETRSTKIEGGESARPTGSAL